MRTTTPRRAPQADDDNLSGRQLSVHDDIDAVLARIGDVRDTELYVLGVRTLPAAGEQLAPSTGIRSARDVKSA